MFKTSYMREVRKDKYERSDVFEEEEPAGDESSAGASAIQGWESLQELNGRFARYINRARVLEQRNAVFRKQLETLQRMEEVSGLEEAFTEQIDVNRQRIRELSSEHAKLERELKDACRMLDEYTSKYRNECEYQEQLRSTLEQLNREADQALLGNLEHQIQNQFLQDDILSTRDRHKKNLAEIQTYVNILHQINQTAPLLQNMSMGISEDQERLLTQRRVPELQSQLEEYKSAICQLQMQKQRLQTETGSLEQAIKSTQDGYDDEIQAYNDQIEALRKTIEEAERSLERYTSECRHLAMYQTSLENELERYKRIIENEDNRLNSAIIGTPITLFTTNCCNPHAPTAPSRGRDLTQAIQDITTIKPRQKNLAKKVQKKKELGPRDVTDCSQDDCPVGPSHGDAAGGEDEVVRRTEQSTGSVPGARVPPQDVPDGAQLSKAFDTLCNIVRDRMRKYRRPEPIADFYTKGRYVLVTGDASYMDPCFCTSSPSGGHVFITAGDGMFMPPYDPPYGPGGPAYPQPPPPPMPMPMPGPSDPTLPSGGGDRKGDDGGKGKDGGGGGNGGGGRGKGRNGDPKAKDPEPSPAPGPGPGPGPGPAPRPAGPYPSPGDTLPTGPRGRRPTPGSPPTRSYHPDTLSYEKVEVLETVERLSSDNKVKGYEETALVVETTVEKISKKKPRT
ncbi:filensin [Gadus chalcogrammus]|uniref:filensin n=1 Tax=Gadus chalcogrammus TaxID=1042646 RepID=UPI0024C47D45|nr:filensin [Gadus chalcogrammus]